MTISERRFKVGAPIPEEHYTGGECWCRSVWMERDGFRGLAHHTKNNTSALEAVDCVGPHPEPAIPFHECQSLTSSDSAR